MPIYKINRIATAVKTAEVRADNEDQALEIARYGVVMWGGWEFVDEYAEVGAEVEENGSYAKRQRNTLGLTQEHLAAILGITKRTIITYEADDATPPPMYLIALDALVSQL